MAISVINNTWERLAFGDASETWVDAGGATNVRDTLYYLSNNGSRGESLSKNGTVGWAYDIGAGGRDLSDSVISSWVLVNIAGILRTLSNGGLSIVWAPDGATWGAGNANNYEYYVGGADTYFGGWKKFFIDPTKTDTLGNTPTVAQLQAIRYIGYYFRVENVTVPGNVNNSFIDSIDVHRRPGLNIIGTSADLFEDLYTLDTVDGTGNAGQEGPIGIFTKENNVYLSNARLLIGSGTQNTDVTGVGSTVVFTDPFFSGNGVNTSVPLAPLEPALEVGGLGYHFSGNDTKVQFGEQSLVGGVTTITAGTKYELIFGENATGNFYSSRFDEVGVYAGTGTTTTILSESSVKAGGWDSDGYISGVNSNYFFNNCQFNNCNQILPRDSIWSGGFITDYDSVQPLVGGEPGPKGEFGAVRINSGLFNMTDVSFIGNLYAIAFLDSGTYNFQLNFSSNKDYNGSTPVDIVNLNDGDVIVQVLGGDTPTSGAYSKRPGGIDIQNSVTLTLTDIVVGSEVRLYKSDPTGIFPTELAGTESEDDGTFQYIYNFTGNFDADIVVLNTGYVYFRQNNNTLTDNAATIKINQVFDRNYENP